ncbi:hypothetical protein RND81_04G224500 [Saponaria officinalis]|uniref:Uncharacterized protein n=1 Tax=Saponaria officinalis TaxID=3572 RepID=A0AAW1LKR7_SAPOF
MDNGYDALVGKLDDLELTLKNPREDDNNSDSDDGSDRVEFLAVVEEGLGADVLSILGKNPGLIRTGDLVGNTVLHMAARDGDIVTVCNLIAFLEESQDEDLKEVFRDVNVDGDAALHMALKNGHRKVAYHLLKMDKCTAIIWNNDGITPYHLAEKAGFSEVCQLSNSSRRPDSLDVDAKMEQVRRDLISESRSIHVQWAELKMAIEVGEEDALITGLRRDGKELLWHKDREGKTLLHAAVEAYKMGSLTKLVQFMISNGLTDAALLRDRNGDTALHTAIERRGLNMAVYLIKAEPTAVYQVNHKGVSPLRLAIEFRYINLVKLMVTQSCLPPWESQMRLHPKHANLAHLATRAESFGILELLLRHLPELVKGTDEKGWRPLSHAANRGFLDGVTYLLTNFPKSAEKCDKDGYFPIHKAVGGGRVCIVKAFYEHCPQTFYHIDHKGRNILQIAVCYERADIVTYLTKELKLDDSLLNLKDNKARGIHQLETGLDRTIRTRTPQTLRPDQFGGDLDLTGPMQNPTGPVFPELGPDRYFPNWLMRVFRYFSP